jgi:hypothetical protein
MLRGISSNHINKLTIKIALDRLTHHLGKLRNRLVWQSPEGDGCDLFAFGQVALADNR